MSYYNKSAFEPAYGNVYFCCKNRHFLICGIRLIFPVLCWKADSKQHPWTAERRYFNTKNFLWDLQMCILGCSKKEKNLFVHNFLIISASWTDSGWGLRSKIVYFETSWAGPWWYFTQWRETGRPVLSGGLLLFKDSARFTSATLVEPPPRLLLYKRRTLNVMFEFMWGDDVSVLG